MSTRSELLKALRKSELVTVNFRKVDGSKRKMLCTLNENVLSKKRVNVSDDVNSSRNDPNIVVFDLERQDWRTIANVNESVYDFTAV